MEKFKSVDESESKVRFNTFGIKVSPENYLYTVATEGISHHFGQSAEDVVLLRFFNRRKNGFYVDVGAFHPRKYSNTYALHKYYSWHGINIDASEEAILLFQQERPKDINIHTAVGIEEESRPYWKFDFPARNTISLNNVERQLEKGAKIIGKETVKVRPLAQLLDEAMPVGKQIDLLNLDVEGVELQVLKSNNWDKYRPLVLLVEDYSVQKNGVESSEIYKYLFEKGYKFFSHHFDTTMYVNVELMETLDTAGQNVEMNKDKLTFAGSSISRANYILSPTIEKFERVIEKLEIEYKQETKTLQNKHEQETKTLQNKHKQDKAALQIEHLNEIELLKSKEDELKLLLIEKEKSIGLLDRELKDLREKNKSLINTNAEQAERLNQIAEYEEKINELLEHQIQTKDKLFAFIEYTRQIENLRILKLEYNTLRQKNKKIKLNVNKTKNKLRQVKSENSKLNKEKNRYKKLYREILNSSSWRYTAVLRKLFNSLRGRA